MKCNCVGFTAKYLKKPVSDLRQDLEDNYQGLNLNYMPQGDVEQENDVHSGDKPTANLRLACIYKGTSSVTGISESVCEGWS